jgi:hypothetical protein
MIKKYDIVATVGTYQKGGETKNRFKNVGVMMEKDGKPFLLLERTFNLAGLPNPQGKDTVLLSLYEPKDKGSDYNQGLQQKGNVADSNNDLSDEIPF